ncbi:hypothetical protein JHK82_035041 [Glycine max]|nr:hypothetical protein JHK85_035778 [Glycine max]KAG4975670.1 hypothetical protein JHK86_035144 [Glycine max]KAG5111772.1 hypothetical protein JHK82_035041 [Glycine max]KAG5129058.1 hypothetical protein JHK84_035455 [Glycine max]
MREFSLLSSSSSYLLLLAQVIGPSIESCASFGSCGKTTLEIFPNISRRSRWSTFQRSLLKNVINRHQHAFMNILKDIELYGLRYFQTYGTSVGRPCQN